MKRDRTITFIRSRLPAVKIAGLDGLQLHLANASSGLSRLVGNDVSPYWAWCWGGGLTLARYIGERSHCVAGKRVLDLGSGSGLVAIAAALAGATEVHAAETDPMARIAIELNTALNGVEVLVIEDDILGAMPPDVHVVCVGDLFYAPDLAARVTRFLDACLAAGIEVLVGDVGRTDLPHDRLLPIASFEVADFGFGREAMQTGTVYRFVSRRL